MHIPNIMDSQNYVTASKCFEPEEIQEIFELVESIPEQEGQAGDKVNEKIRKSKIKWIQNNDNSAWLYDRINQIVLNLNDMYFRAILTNIPEIQFTEYSDEYQGFYVAHSDSKAGVIDENKVRKISMVVQLSDPANYEGGELLLYPERLEPVRASKEQASATLFRSHILHRVTPVTKGKRYSLVVWVEGPAWR